MERQKKERTFDDYLAKKLKNREFKKNFEEESLKLDLAIKIIKLRKQLKLTQNQFADRMNTSQEAISRIERGDYEGFTLKTLKKIADATNTELYIEFRPKKLKRAS